MKELLKNDFSSFKEMLPYIILGISIVSIVIIILIIVNQHVISMKEKK